MAVARRVRIGEWLVPYDDATDPVIVERGLGDILKAIPGNDLECMNSRCIRAQRNRHVFNHPVYLVSTIKTRVFIVDALTDSGEPAHAIRYALSRKASRDIEAHDVTAGATPGPLRLSLPPDPKGSPKRAAYPKRYADTNAGTRAKGNGKATRTLRPVSHGARARYVAAVGALQAEASK